MKERDLVMQFDPTLYLITDSTYHTADSLLATVDEALAGGATLVQLREKDAGGRAYLALAERVKAVTDRYGVPLIIDDRADVALACDAAGVHVGAEDLPVEAVRRLLGPDKIVGATAKTIEAAVSAYAQGADYLGTGAVYPTTTHVTTKITPVETLNAICRAVPIPVIAIGGLTADNMGVLANSPIAGVAVVSAVMKAEDPRLAAETLRGGVLRMRKEDMHG
ncbi:thiamine phosphate synthase [Butyricicoccus faecihominis]|uniref:thiamine phosphate synthase n=1 Tax=Butyricicoccus faecihominis TaxID=1712515 RepID=UPI0024796120|nr:thiamine phosphate synthase [Butyricicoccus faecihominis]MCQ5128737.1 thiamine phosphate synthase [Butyricicoccus faecihominis]